MNYEFVPGDTIEIEPGKVLHRIRATTYIEAHGVTPGDLGGYIESPENLGDQAWVSSSAWVSGNAHVSDNAIVSDDAWVFGNATVSGDAMVSGDARVFGDARVSGNARVYGSAWVYGNARVYGDAQVSGDARVSDNAMVYGNAWVCGNAYVCGDAMIDEDGLIFWASKVGSENGTLTVYNTKSGGLGVTRGCFHGSVEEFLAASKAKHDDTTHREYRLLIEVAVSRINDAIRVGNARRAERGSTDLAVRMNVPFERDALAVENAMLRQALEGMNTARNGVRH